MADKAAVATRAATLSTFDTVSVIVGIVIGAGIYETPPFVFSSVSSGTLALVAWAVGGLLCLNGAFTYAELASAYPRSGGDYIYLSRAFGSWLGFLFGWAQISVILTGSIGMMAYVFANYAATLWDFGPATMLTYAVGSVVVLSLTNLCGVALGKYVQNVLSSAKLLGLAAVIVAGLLAVPPQVEPISEQAATTTATTSAAIASFASALVLVFLTYGGWNDAAFFVAEMRDRKKIIRALSLGILIITVVYLLINAAYLRASDGPGCETPAPLPPMRCRPPSVRSVLAAWHYWYQFPHWAPSTASSSPVRECMPRSAKTIRCSRYWPVATAVLARPSGRWRLKPRSRLP